MTQAQGPQQLEEGKTYRFEPPMVATGCLGEGDAARLFPGLRFPSGRLVEITTWCYEFRGEIDGQTYKFFAFAMLGGSKATECRAHLSIVK
jgi:hypothetical protein